MNLSAPFIRRPVMTTYIMIALLIAGYLAFNKLPVSDLPNIQRPEIGVTASYTGATPETMVKLVTQPLEKELINVGGVKEISSVSSQGGTHIDLKFDYDKNMSDAAREIQAALNRAQGSLPSDLDERPSYRTEAAQHDHIMYLLLTSGTMSVAELREYSDAYITPRLTRIEGVAEVETFGPPFAVKIQVNPESLAMRQIGIDEVINAIKQHNAELPLGKIKASNRDITIDLPNNFKNAKTIENIVVGKGPVYLKDVGTVTFGPESDIELRYLSKDQKKLALIMGIKKQNGANTVSISEAVRKVIPDIVTDLPPSIHLDLWFDKAIWIKESIHDVEWTLLFAFGLVVLVIFFSLGRLSEALIPSLALPMSLIGTCIAMYLLNFSLDLLSLLALTLSVGFVVDDAIVVLENIVRHNEKGETPLQASLIGSKQICFTILSMTLSLVAVFIPLLFMKDLNALLFREFSITLAIAIIISGFISLSLTPMLCSRFLSKKREETKLQGAIHRVNDLLIAKYKRTLEWCLEHPKTILSVALVCFVITIPLFRSLPVDLFPKEDRGFIFSFVSLSKGVSSDKSKAYQNKIEELVKNNPYVDCLIDLNFKDQFIVIMKLVPKSKRPDQEVIMKEINDQINALPGTLAFTNSYQLIDLDLGQGRGGNYQFMIRGIEFSEVEGSAQNLKSAMQANPNFTFVDVSVKSEDPKLIVTVDENQARQLGLNRNHVQSVIQKAYSGGKVGKVTKGAARYNVTMELASGYKNQVTGLGKLHLKGADGSFIPLKVLASWRETLGSPTLHRVDQLPAVTINFAVSPAISTKDAFEIVQTLAVNNLSPNVSGKLHGLAAMIDSTTRDTALLILAAVIVMYIVLGILYESFLHPLTILSSLPFAGLGGMLTLMLFNIPLSIYSVVGFLLLIGIVKKNGIMMIDYALEAAREPSVSARQAIFDGCLVRFRPIMMTTIAAIMGALPIAIGFGDGAETRRGLGLVIVGGLLFSQLLTLYVTPVIFLTLEKLKNKKFITKKIIFSNN